MTEDPRPERSISRRTYVTAAGTTVLVALAGCPGTADDANPTDEETPTDPTGDPSPTTTPTEGATPTARSTPAGSPTPAVPIEEPIPTPAVPPETPATSPTGSRTSLEPGELIAYRNQEYGYTIDHPQPWEVDGDGTATVIVNSPDERYQLQILVQESAAFGSVTWNESTRAQYRSVLEESLATNEDVQETVTVEDMELANGTIAVFMELLRTDGLRVLAIVLLRGARQYVVRTVTWNSIFTANVESLFVDILKSFGTLA